MKYTPSNITSLLPNQIFVMGTNLSGIHGAGAARTGYTLFKAEYGVGVGLTGQCYCIPTKDFNIKTLPLSEIKKHIEEFILFCINHPHLEFLCTEIGCGLAGYSPKDIAPLFEGTSNNIIFPKSFYDFFITQD